MKESVLFLLGFLALNFTIFIPSWLIGAFSKIENLEDSFFNDSLFFIAKKSFYIRHTDDFLRFVLELQIVSLCILLLTTENSIQLKYLYLGIFIFSFVYVTYIAIFTKVFKKMPNLVNDIGFAKTGAVLFKKQIPLLLIGLIILLGVVAFVGTNLIEFLISSAAKIDSKWPLVSAIGLSALSGLVAILKINYNQYHNCVSFSFVKHGISNLLKSIGLLKSLKNLNMAFPYAYADEISLREKPNIIFVFLESYGSFTLSNKAHGHEVLDEIEKLNTLLVEKEWSSMSCLSESPVASGGSWLSHSSVFFGAEVKDAAAHDSIFGSTDYPARLASLPRFLSNQGYHTKLASTVSHGKNEVNWSKLKNSYPFDDIMLINKFNYKGKKVYFNGNRYTIPDEYTLNCSYNSILDKSPYFLSVSTTNSHYNFVSPIHAMADWRDYETKDFALTDGIKKNSLKNYFTAMKYHFDYLSTFFSNQNLDNTIVVLIGDHQPPMVTPLHIDKNTPIHIISKNQDFLNTFKEFGYSKGLIPTKKASSKHESFFSKFIYALNKTYGGDTSLTPPIFENGINLY